jgi:hypothetical protein
MVFTQSLTCVKAACLKSRRSRRMIVAHRLIGGTKEGNISGVRETDGCVLNVSAPYICSVVRFTDSIEPFALPSAEALGYFRSVRFADDEKTLLRQSPSMPSLKQGSRGERFSNHDSRRAARILFSPVRQVNKLRRGTSAWYSGVNKSEPPAVAGGSPLVGSM